MKIEELKDILQYSICTGREKILYGNEPDVLLHTNSKGDRTIAVIVLYHSHVDKSVINGLIERYHTDPEGICHQRNCRILKIFADQIITANTNTRSRAFQGIWIYGTGEIQQMKTRKQCCLHPHNELTYQQLGSFVKYTLSTGKGARGALILPTGLGKSYLMGRVISDFPEARVMVVVPTDIIREQIRDIASNYPTDVEIITYAKLDHDWKHAANFMERYAALDIVLFDEIHHSVAESYSIAVNKLIDGNRKAAIIGLTATPMGGKDRKANSIDVNFEKTILGKVTFNEAWRYMLLPEPYMIRSKEYVYADRQAAGQKKRSTKDTLTVQQSENQRIIATLHMDRRACYEIREAFLSGIKRAILFVDEWRNLEDVQRLWNSALLYCGIDWKERVRYITLKGEDGSMERARNKRLFEEDQPGDDRIKILIGARMVEEGYHPNCHIDMGIFGFSSNSKNKIIQMLGRTQYFQTGFNFTNPYILDLFNCTTLLNSESDYIEFSAHPFILGMGNSTQARPNNVHVKVMKTKKIRASSEFKDTLGKRILHKGMLFKTIEEYIDSYGNTPDLRPPHFSENIHNKNLYEHFGDVLVNRHHKFHGELADLLKSRGLTESLDWPDMKFPNLPTNCSLENLSERMDKIWPVYLFHMKRIDYIGNLSVEQHRMVRRFFDDLARFMQDEVADAFNTRYNLHLTRSIAHSPEAPEVYRKVSRICEELPTLPGSVKPYGFNYDTIYKVEDKVSVALYRLLCCIEAGKDTEVAAKDMCNLVDPDNWEILDEHDKTVLEQLDITMENLKDAWLWFSKYLPKILKVQGKAFNPRRAASFYNEALSPARNRPEYIHAVTGAVLRYLPYWYRLYAVLASYTGGGCSIRDILSSDERMEQAMTQYERMVYTVGINTPNPKWIRATATALQGQLAEAGRTEDMTRFLNILQEQFERGGSWKSEIKENNP